MNYMEKKWEMKTKPQFMNGVKSMHKYACLPNKMI